MIARREDNGWLTVMSLFSVTLENKLMAQEMPHFCYSSECSWVCWHLMHGSISDFLGILASPTYHPAITGSHADIYQCITFFLFVFLGIGDNDSCTANIFFKKVMSLIWQTSAFMIMKIHIFFYYYDICAKIVIASSV